MTQVQVKRRMSARRTRRMVRTSMGFASTPSLDVRHADGKRSEKDSDLKLDSEVRHNEPICEQLAIEVGKMNDCMINQDKLIKRGTHERNELKAKLESALLEIDILSLLLLSLMFL